MLLDRGANVNLNANVGFYGTALIAAMFNVNRYHEHFVSMLLDRGADVNAVATVGDYGTALIAAMNKDNRRVVSMLLDRGADINIIIRGGRYKTILGAITALAREHYYEHFLNTGADINAVGDDRGSELGTAAYEGDQELVSFLLSRGADPFHTGGKYNTIGYGYPTALDAARSGKAGPKLIELLVKVMAERSSTSGNEPSPPFPMPYARPCAFRQVLDEATPLLLLAAPSFESIINPDAYGIPGLIAEHADLPCRSFKTDILINILVALVGINTQAAERLEGWIRNDVGYFVLQDYDLGLAYAAARVGWKNFNKPHFNVALHRAQWLKRAREIDQARNTSLAYHEHIDTQQLIKQPYEVMPRRIWDVMSNRVVEFRMLHSETLASQDCASGFVSQLRLTHRDTVPVYWAITHSWTAIMESVSTSVNQYQWPVPLPPGLDLGNHLRKELQLLGLETMYIWLDVLCLRQHGRTTRSDMQKTVDAMNRLREEEWKIDVPTIGNIYRAAEGTVRYFNGLGQPFVNEGWESPRHWLKRASTLQEIRTQ